MSYLPERKRLAALETLAADIAITVNSVVDGDYRGAIREIRGLLTEAGVHPGQTDADGRPVFPPHDWTCTWCKGGQR